MTDSNLIQCLRMSLGGGKLQQPQPFSAVGPNAPTIADHAAQMALCRIKALSCSQPKKCNLLVARDRGPLKPSSTTCMQLGERVLAVSATLSCALARQLQRLRKIWTASTAPMNARRVASKLMAVVSDEAAKEVDELCTSGQCAAALIPLQRATLGICPHAHSRRGCSYTAEKAFSRMGREG